MSSGSTSRGNEMAVPHLIAPISTLSASRVVGHEHQRGGVLPARARQQIEHDVRILVIETAGWFIGQDQCRLGDDRARYQTTPDEAFEQQEDCDKQAERAERRRTQKPDQKRPISCGSICYVRHRSTSRN